MESGNHVEEEKANFETGDSYSLGFLEYGEKGVERESPQGLVGLVSFRND